MGQPTREFVSLEGKTALVTGSGRGLGKATALFLASRGADLVVNDVDRAAAEAVSLEVEALGRRARISQHDVSSYAQAGELVAFAQEQFGQLDILINNAGITRDALLTKMTEELWDQVIRVNLKGTFNMGQAAAKAMSGGGGGAIVNLSSVAWLGNVGQSNYSASKAGVVGLTRTWALELSRYKIRVNAVAPGMVDTDLTKKVPAEIMTKFIQKIPLARIGAPEDIAHLVGFLASDSASYITGQVFTIDGGLSVGI